MRIRNKGLKNPLIKMVHFNIFLVTTGNMLTMIYFIIYQISKGVTLTGRSALFGTLSHMTILHSLHFVLYMHNGTGN